MVGQMLHEHAAALSAASPANRSRRLIKCAKESARYREAAKPEGNDYPNADVIIKSLKKNILSHHPKNWALHLAGAGRRLIEKKLTNQKMIRAYLEAAIPEYDREGPIYAKKGP
jgi:hypothetical protein